MPRLVRGIKYLMRREMNGKTEGAIAIIAALLVLFSAMFDPRMPVGVILSSSLDILSDLVRASSELGSARFASCC